MVNITIFKSTSRRWRGHCHQYSDSVQAGQSGYRIPLGGEFSMPTAQALRPTQPPVQWVMGSSWR